jgi:hypothetical protein
MMIGNDNNRNMVKQQKYTMNLPGLPPSEIFSCENISNVARQNKKKQMANHFIQVC